MLQRKAEHFRDGIKIGETAYVVSDEHARRDQAEQALHGTRGQLRAWAQQAQADADGYGAMTAAQRQAAQERTIRRFGLLCQVLRHALLLIELDTDDGET